MEIYIYLVAATLIFGMIMPQQGPQRKKYIILMAVIHAFVCGFRYQYLTGDLMKYQWAYSHLYDDAWFSEAVWDGGRNAGFTMLMKLVALLFDNQFQPFLVITAIVGEICVAILVYRYSPAPWMSYLVWNCLGFYIFGFSAVKQALAMAVLMIAFIGVAERNLKFYLISMTVAGLIHTPSLIFLPAYWLATRKVTLNTVILYILLGIGVFAFKDQVVAIFSSFYFEDDELFMYSGRLGGRFFMILIITCCSFLVHGFGDRKFDTTFHLMAIATILQMLAGFDHMFTRLTDYYFQFSVLFIPMLFFKMPGEYRRITTRPMFPFNRRSLHLLAAVVCVCLMGFYYIFNLDVEIIAVDNYLNFRFMWDVK